MTSKKDVEIFLKEFKINLKIFGVVFLDNRGSNFQTLADLDIRPIEREYVLEKLMVRDYSEGPLDENQHGGIEMWVFGVMFKSQEIYIKITLGVKNCNVICISFHKAEYPMNYPFKI